jgi:hypothetical protein
VVDVLVDVQFKRAVFVELRGGPDAEVGEELVGVDEAAEDAAAELVGGDHEEQDAFVLAAVEQRGDVVAEVRTMAHEPLHAMAEAVEVGDLRCVDGGDGEQGMMPTMLADAHAGGFAIGDAEQVVVEAVAVHPRARWRRACSWRSRS